MWFSRNAVFADRAAAGVQLARKLRNLTLPPPLVVLGLPRGGVVVAFEVAQALRAPLDLLVVRKIGSPGQEEFAVGAIAPGSIVVHESGGGSGYGPDIQTFERLVQAERIELERRESTYRRGLPPLELAGKTAILVDDGLATGWTMLAAVRAARQLGASLIVAAAPVASEEAAARVAAEADQIAILNIPSSLRSVGEWYEDFTQIDDTEVRDLLTQARASRASADLPAAASGQ